MYAGHIAPPSTIPFSQKRREVWHSGLTGAGRHNEPHAFRYGSAPPARQLALPQAFWFLRSASVSCATRFRTVSSVLACGGTHVSGLGALFWLRVLDKVRAQAGAANRAVILKIDILDISGCGLFD